MWSPVIVSLVLQVPAPLFAAVYRDDFRIAAVIAIGVSISDPLLLDGARRFPGPTVARIWAWIVLGAVSSRSAPRKMSTS